MRQVSVLFINMKLPDLAGEASEALQKAFEVVHEACTKYKGTFPTQISPTNGHIYFISNPRKWLKKVSNFPSTEV